MQEFGEEESLSTKASFWRTKETIRVFLEQSYSKISKSTANQQLLLETLRIGGMFSKFLHLHQATLQIRLLQHQTIYSFSFSAVL